MRRTAPIWWNAQPPGNCFDDDGFWLVTKHKDVGEISGTARCSPVREDGATPLSREFPGRTDRGRQAGAVEHGCPHHTHLRQIISPRFHSPRAVRVAARDLDRRAQDIARPPPPGDPATSWSRWPASCRCRLSSPVGCSGCRWRTARSCSTGRIRWSATTTRVRAPRQRHRFGGTDHVRDVACRLRAERNPATSSPLIQADVEGHKLSDDEFPGSSWSCYVAGNETTRLDHPRHDRLRRTTPTRELTGAPAGRRC